MIVQEPLIDYHQMLDKMSKLLLIDSPKHKKTTKILKPVQFQSNKTSIESIQYRDLFNDRLEQFNDRFQQSIFPLSKIDSDLTSKIYVCGLIKRLRSKRVKVFDKQYVEIMGINGYGKETIIYSEDDELQIQDKTGKIKFQLHEKTTMNGNLIKNTDLPYGIIVCLHGKFSKKINKLIVNEIILPKPLPQCIIKQYTNNKSKTLICSQASKQKLQQIAYVLQGKKSSSNSFYLSEIESIIVIGGFTLDSESIKQYNNILMQMSKSIAVYVMPSNFTTMEPKFYPKIKYHKLFFPNELIQKVQNPQKFIAENETDLIVVGGENVQDFLKNTSLAKNEIQVLQHMIKFQHLCPTAPYSLKSDLKSEDKLVLKRIPHFLISGGCSSFSESLLTIQQTSVKLITVKKNSVVYVDLMNKSQKAFELNLRQI